TKSATPVGAAIVFFTHELPEEFAYRRKQAGQLCWKMRFLSAPWVGLLRDGALLRNAARANAMARRLLEQVRQIPEVKILFPTQATAVFADLPPHAVVALRHAGWKLYTFPCQGGRALIAG